MEDTIWHSPTVHTLMFHLLIYVDNINCYIYTHTVWSLLLTLSVVLQMPQPLQDECISRSVNVAILVICASMINNISPADTASINLIEGTDLINFCLLIASLNCQRRTNGSKSLVSLIYSKFYTICLWGQTDNWIQFWPSIKLIIWYWTNRPGQLLAWEKRKRQRHTQTHTQRRENRFHTGDTGLVVSVM